MVNPDTGAHGGAPLLAMYRAVWEPLLGIARLFAAPERLATDLPDHSGVHGAAPSVWLHAASLGECKGLWAFAQTLWAANPHMHLVFTTNTVTGLAFLREALAIDPANREHGTARLAPLDHPRVAARLLRAFDVRALVLFEVELWPHWMLAARQQKGGNVPVFWISARVTERARRRYAGNRFFAAALRRVLGGITWTQAQTESEADWLRACGAPRIETGGDLRGLYYLAAAKSAHAHLPESSRHGVAFVSLHAEELPAIVPVLREARTDEPIHVFPRKLKELQAFRQALEPLGFTMRSEQSESTRQIVDSFGLVAKTLQTTRVAVIGGSFLPHDRIGGHNLWEPLLTGAPIVIGSHHGNQLYLVRRLENAGLLRVARNFAELSEALNAPVELMVAPEAQNKMAEARENFIASERVVLQQATERAADMILTVLKKRD
jgi:3-deoxy-D-manno-octulosonic-acid transferase